MKHMFTVCHDDPYPFRGAHLRPYADEGVAWIRRMNPGDIIEVDVVRPRSQQHHRLFFAMLKIVSDNLDNCSVDNLLDIIKIGIGHTKIVKMPDGRLYAIPMSISFSSLDQDAFAEIFTKAGDYVIQEILPGIDRDALTYEVFAMAGVPMALIDQ